MIIKNDGQRENYDREKLIAGITLACTKRPVSQATIEKIVAGIETQIADEMKLEIESFKLGEMVLSKLINLDQVAYVRFASVYRRFQNINEFRDELNKLKVK
jgi:transcriptional repressor NrdR